MTIFAIYYIDEYSRDYFLRREDAMECGIDHIRQVCREENWDPQETESLIAEFIREEWAYDICALEEIEVKE